MNHTQSHNKPHSSTLPLDSKLQSPRRDLKFKNFSFESNFVSMFAICLCVLQCFNKISFFCNQISNEVKTYIYVLCSSMESWIFCHHNSCLVGTKNISYNFCYWWRSTRILLSQTVWQAVKTVATYSASDKDNADVACFFELHVIAPGLRLKTLVEVLFLSSNKLVQSLSMKPHKLKLVTYVFQIL